MRLLVWWTSTVNQIKLLQKRTCTYGSSFHELHCVQDKEIVKSVVNSKLWMKLN